MNASNLSSERVELEACDYLMVLRGLSALAVVFCHLPFELHKWFPSNSFLASAIGDGLDWVLNPFGYIPVLIFFSLSGYLITLGFFSGRHDSTSLNGIKIYYRSRVFRILPLYYFSIVLCVLLYWNLAVQSPMRVVKLFAFIENYKPANGIIFNHVYWTMPVEMLYFLMAPFIYLLLKKCVEHTKDWVIFCMLIVVFVGIALAIFYGLSTESGAFIVDRKDWSLMARFDFIYNLMAFVLGGACVFIVKNKSYRNIFIGNRQLIKIMTCLWLTSVSAYCSTQGLAQLNVGRLSYFIAFGLIPSIALVVLGVAILNETQIFRTNLYSKYFVYLGLLSYGIYLFHMPVFETLQKYLVNLNVQLTEESMSLLALCLTLVLSHITYQCVEKPFLQRRVN